METKVDYPGRNREDILFDSIIWHLRNSINNGKQNLSGGECEKYFREVVKKNNENKMKNVLAELLEHIKNTSKEELEKEFNELEEWSNVGPTVEEFMTFCESVNKKLVYPKTYDECCEILFPNAIPLGKVLACGYGCESLKALGELRICRDAYWKIAGEEMGLGKPWESENPSRHYVFSIENFGGKIQKNATVARMLNRILVFPTEEMRDAFYENFKDLIEQCKELL